jgi:hypothetical protein
MNGIKTGKVVLRQLMYTTKKMRIRNKGRFGGKYVKGDTVLKFKSNQMLFVSDQQIQILLT